MAESPSVSAESAELAALKEECARLKDALRVSEEHQSILFDRNPVPVFVYNAKNFQILAINDATLRNYGYTREEFLKMSLPDMHPTKEIPALGDHLSRIAKTSSSCWTHRKKNGFAMTVEIFSDEVTYNGIAARMAVVVDITDRAAAEENLRRSEERFELVSKATSDAVWDLDIETDKLWWSAGYCAIFGYDRREVQPEVGWWENHIHIEERERVVNSLRAAIASKDASSWTEEYRYRRKDGSYANVQDRGHIIRDAAGKPIRMVGGMTDITEHKNLLNRYQRAQRMESIGTLAGGIAHDLNNVLAPILMSVELLRLNAVDENAIRLINTVDQSARRGADLVRQVLTFARGLEGNRRTTIKIEHLIKDTARIAVETFPKNITTEVSLTRDLWAILGDATQIHQILLNLVVNARDAMCEDGGTLTLSAENVTIDEQYVGRDAKQGPHICVSVSDTGCGIPAHELEKIFEPFFTTKDVGKGTGLGLSTAAAIIKSHGGFITVHSVPFKGTMFKVYFPADPDSRATEPVTVPAELPRGQGETLLLIDDEASILTITQQTLQAFGYRVIIAHDGSEAVALYAQYRDVFAAVLTDMVMPILDGPSTISALMRINPKVVIIAASGLNANGRIAKAAEAGVKHFLPKPYTAETLLTTLRDVLRPGEASGKSPESSAA